MGNKHAKWLKKVVYKLEGEPTEYWPHANRHRCGPPKRWGGYDKYNWCKLCKGIHTKDIIRCPDCNQQMRTTSKAKFGDNSRNLTKKEKLKRKIEVQADLARWQNESFK